MPPEPEVHPDRTVTFRVYAPAAETVQVAGRGQDRKLKGMGPFEMARDEEGNWTVTTPPIPPGWHYYQLLVDGFGCVDPSGEATWGWGVPTSGLEVPDPDLDFHEFRDVPHGEVRIRWYRSGTTGLPRRCFVYTPPGYDGQAGERYPVLYLQHGSGESELSWPQQGRTGFIMDNLIAEGRALPMLVVMEKGYASRPGEPDPRWQRGSENLFGRVLLDDLVPMIDGTYRSKAERDHRALAGLSMGAGQAMRIGLANLDVFGSIGALSGGGREFDPKTSFGGVFADADEANKKLNLLWIGCGREDGLFPHARSLHEALSRHGVEHVWFECDGDHEWHVWRRHLYELAPLLFRG